MTEAKTLTYQAEDGCGYCRFWKPNNMHPEAGLCLRNAPRASEDGGKTIWPTTADVHWCGDWELSLTRKKLMEEMSD